MSGNNPGDVLYDAIHASVGADIEAARANPEVVPKSHRHLAWPPRLSKPERLIFGGSLAREPYSSEIASEEVAPRGFPKLGSAVIVLVMLGVLAAVFLR